MNKSVQLGSDGLAIEPPTVTSSTTRWTHRKPSTGTREPRVRQSTPLLVLPPLSGNSPSPTLSASSSSSSVTHSTSSANASSISPSSSSASLSLPVSTSHHGNNPKTSKSVPVSPKRHGTGNTGMGKSTPVTIPSPSTLLPPFSMASLSARVAANGNVVTSSSIVLPPTTGSGPTRVDVGVPPKNTWKYLEIDPGQVECPRCHLSSSTVPSGYWKERDELIFMCSALFVDRMRPEGYRICGAHWTPSERVAICECGAMLDIECHHRNYIYVCPSCHSMSHTSRHGDPPKIRIKDMS